MTPTIREARFPEQARIAHIFAAAFWDNGLFGDMIHPHRKKFPADNDLYWLRRCQVDWWDYTHRFIVSTTTDADGREIVTGVAHWARLGKGGKSMECWWFDPRNLAKPVAVLSTSIAARIWPNRAADAAKEDIIERCYPYYKHVWSGSRAESWYLETLAVHPDYQNQGIGRALVKWGLDQAERECVSASVVSDPGKGRFYARCGFDTQAGTANMGEGNPLPSAPGAPILFREVTKSSR